MTPRHQELFQVVALRACGLVSAWMSHRVQHQNIWTARSVTHGFAMFRIRTCLRQQWWLKGWRALLRLQGREVRLLCSTWQRALVKLQEILGTWSHLKPEVLPRAVRFWVYYAYSVFSSISHALAFPLRHLLSLHPGTAWRRGRSGWLPRVRSFRFRRGVLSQADEGPK